ncbi:hypothetical protein [Raineyella sp.]|uniref:hypothetical protein n=1 Tax=Raineyella sp. TaxID=1911550 RepID=UPI002B20051E|nr:hypothetical protein [Raineyella sp.]MEA5155223.1 hypothetical protein [Raineyella sp.]
MDEQAGGEAPLPGEPIIERPVSGTATILIRRLLVAGLLGGHLGLVGSTLALGIVRGGVAGASAAVGAVIAILFFSIGQAVVLRYAERDGSVLLVAALVSYGIRVSGLAGVVALYEASGLTLLDRTATALGIVATVLLWTTAEVVAFARMRIPVYDLGHPERPGAGGE